MSSHLVDPRSVHQVERTRAALQSFQEAFRRKTRAAKDMTEALAADELLNCADIFTCYYRDGCRTWQELLLYYGLSDSQGERLKHLLTPLMGTVTVLICGGYHLCLGEIYGLAGDEEGWMVRVEYLRTESAVHLSWTLCALYLARHPEYPVPEFMPLD